MTLFLMLGLISQAQNYTLMTYNIRYDNPEDGMNAWSNRSSYLIDQIKHVNPDVFGVQEALNHQIDDLSQQLPNYKYVGVGRNDGLEKGEYSAIFYNSDKFSVELSNTFWLSQTPEQVSVGWDAAMERICTLALLKDKNSRQQFLVANTHFDHIGKEARKNSVKLILDKINQFNNEIHPFVLMGDLNLEPNSAPIQYLSNKLQDAYAVSKNSSDFVGTYNGFKLDQKENPRIDYIFTDKTSIEIIKYKVLKDRINNSYPSDHFPVVVTVQIKQKS